MAYPHASASGTRAFDDSAVLLLLLLLVPPPHLAAWDTLSTHQGRGTGSQPQRFATYPSRCVPQRISSHSDPIRYLPARPSHTDSKC